MKRVRDWLETRLIHAWYEGGAPLPGAKLLAWLYGRLLALREWLYDRGFWAIRRIGCPVLVVGNLTVGGTGKTPLVIALAEHLVAWGYRPGILSRGHGANPPLWPYRVEAGADAATTGDEPLLLARRTALPVMIDPDRVRAAHALLASEEVDLLLCDDGLQHRRLGRDLEIVVIDGKRRFGNGLLLPAGPLRSPLSRLKSVSYQVVNGGKADNLDGAVAMQFKPGRLVNLATAEEVEASDWQGDRHVHAVAGIGHPARFFATLRELGFDPIEHPFADHHPFVSTDLPWDDQPLIMTEKDAVKCAAFARPHHWWLRIDAELPDAFWQALHEQVAQLAVPCGSTTGSGS